MKKLVLICLLICHLSSFSQVASAINKNYSRKKADSLLLIIQSDCNEFANLNYEFKSSRIIEARNVIAHYLDTARSLEKIEVYRATDTTLKMEYFFKNSVIFKMGKVQIYFEGMPDFDYYYLDNGIVFRKSRNSSLFIEMEESA